MFTKCIAVNYTFSRILQGLVKGRKKKLPYREIWQLFLLASMVFAIQKPAPPGGLHRGFAPMTPKKNKPLQTSKRHRYSRKNTRPIRG